MVGLIAPKLLECMALQAYPQYYRTMGRTMDTLRPKYANVGAEFDGDPAIVRYRSLQRPRTATVLSRDMVVVWMQQGVKLVLVRRHDHDGRGCGQVGLDRRVPTPLRAHPRPHLLRSAPQPSPAQTKRGY